MAVCEVRSNSTSTSQYEDIYILVRGQIYSRITRLRGAEAGGLKFVLDPFVLPHQHV